MLTHPGFDPVAINLGPLQVHWYGLMYLIGFLAGGWLGVYRANKPGSGWRASEVWDLVFYIAIGAVIGGRLGYVFFYNAAYYLQHPIEIFYLWSGGMAFHGGLLGVLVAIGLFARKTSRRYFAVGDFLAPLCALGLGAGRLGNFINQELWGKVTNVPWAMVFPTVDDQPRHPSQLYEAGLEGLALFIIIWVYSSRPRAIGAVSGWFLICYSIFRFIVEFFRQPDAHIGYLMLDWLTMGQILSLPMFGFGCWLMQRSKSRSMLSQGESKSTETL